MAEVTSKFFDDMEPVEVGQPIWAAAVESGARYVVSDNTNDYPPRQPDGRYIYAGIEYIGGNDFLALVITDLADGAPNE